MVPEKSLRWVREELFRLRLDSVADAARVPAARLAEIEAGASATSFEIEQLAATYGIDSDRLIPPVNLARGDGIPLLAERSEFSQLGDSVRLAVMRAAAAAKDLVELRGANTLAEVRRQLTGPKRDPHARLPHHQGKALALALRRRWKLGTGPIASVRDLVAERVPGLQILYADLTALGPAGVAFADEMRGATLVLNLMGKNENPLVRRFSLLHELCHFLVDWDGHRPLVDLSVYLPEAQLEREQRANAFAVRFLCPETVIVRAAAHADPVAVVREIEAFGVHYSALRLYLKNTASTTLPPQPPDLGQRSHAWQEREEPLGITPFPIEDVPPERRTILAELAARAYSAGRLSRGRFAELLGTTPIAPLERVLDLIGLPRREDTA